MPSSPSLEDDCRRLHAPLHARSRRSRAARSRPSRAQPGRRRSRRRRSRVSRNDAWTLRAVSDSTRRRRRARRRVARRCQASADARTACRACARSARGLARLGVTLRRRADQPARARAADCRDGRRRLGSAPPIVTVDSLAPGGSYQSLVADLEKQAASTRIALVGHEPGIGELAARLIGSRHPFEFKKGAVCRIDVDELPPVGPGDLRWFLTTKMMASMKKK